VVLERDRVVLFAIVLKGRLRRLDLLALLGEAFASQDVASCDAVNRYSRLCSM
jgi:hypothetical protein